MCVHIQFNLSHTIWKMSYKMCSEYLCADYVPENRWFCIVVYLVSISIYSHDNSVCIFLGPQGRFVIHVAKTLHGINKRDMQIIVMRYPVRIVSQRGDLHVGFLWKLIKPGSWPTWLQCSSVCSCWRNRFVSMLLNAWDSSQRRLYQVSCEPSLLSQW